MKLIETILFIHGPNFKIAIHQNCLIFSLSVFITNVLHLTLYNSSVKKKKEFCVEFI